MDKPEKKENESHDKLLKLDMPFEEALKKALSTPPPDKKKKPKKK